MLRKLAAAAIGLAVLLGGFYFVNRTLRADKEQYRVVFAETAGGAFLLDGYQRVHHYLTGFRPVNFSNETISERTKIRYSIFDRNLPTEDEAARLALPEFQVIPGLGEDFQGRTFPPSAEPGMWYRGHADNFSSKYSRLDQINRNNVGELEVAWIFRGGGDWESNIETNPVFGGGKLFVTTPSGQVVAIDAATGAEIWRINKTVLRGARRGVLWWPGNAKTGPRVFIPTGTGTFAVNPENGRVITGFGNAGRVGGASVVPGAVDDDRLIVARGAPSAIEAFNVETGALIWSTPLLKTGADAAPHSGELPPGEFQLGGGVPWGGISLDTNRKRVYTTTGNARPTLYGVTRPGPNEHTTSVVSIDTVTGKVDWSFQEVRHDLWDFDVPSPPNLTAIRRGDRMIDVVAVATKIGGTLLLERDTGKPVFDYRLRRAPVSKVPGEKTAPYQPDPTMPEPFARLPFEPSDITDLSAAQTQSVKTKLTGANFGFFAPPVINGKAVTFGLNGGALWPGAAVDQEAGVLYVPSNQLAWTLRLYYTDDAPNPIRTTDGKGDDLYQRKCGTCHGVNRQGYYESEYTGDRANPSLVGLSATHDVRSVEKFRESHADLKGTDAISADDIKAIGDYLNAADRISDERRSLSVTFAWHFLVDSENLPGSKPPWGRLTALDLNTGKKMWEVPFGEYAELTRRGVPVTGQQNRGGVVVTKGGVVFATGTVDGKIRAFDSATGKELWKSDLPAAGSAPPSTYEMNGIQYLVVPASGGWASCLHCDTHSEKAFLKRSDAIVAFRLKTPLRTARRPDSR